jgi:hypothetical protein
LPSNSHAPVPPNVHLSRALSSHPNESLEYTRAFREAEVARGASQIAAAFEAFDLRNIRQIRRATHETIVHDARTHATATVAGGSVGNQDILIRDEADIGGAEGLAQAHDKSQLRVRRSFEIVMISGHILARRVKNGSNDYAHLSNTGRSGITLMLEMRWTYLTLLAIVPPSLRVLLSMGSVMGRKSRRHPL